MSHRAVPAVACLHLIGNDGAVAVAAAIVSAPRGSNRFFGCELLDMNLASIKNAATLANPHRGDPQESPLSGTALAKTGRHVDRIDGFAECQAR